MNLKMILKRYTPDKRCVFTLEILTAALAGGLMAALCIVLSGTILLSLFAVIAVFFSAVVFVYIPLYISRLSYNISRKSVSRQSGLFFLKTQKIALSAVQHANFIRTPFSRHTGLNFIILHLYGGRLIIAFLSFRDCEELLEYCGCKAE